MNKNLIIAIPLINSIIITFSGCQEIDDMIESATKPEYINVVVTADATVMYRFTFYANDGTTADSNLSNADTIVRFDMVKAKGETYTLYRTTDPSGNTQTASASFNWYSSKIGYFLPVIFESSSPIFRYSFFASSILGICWLLVSK